MSNKKRAWKTTLCGISSIVAARSAGKAKQITVKAAREVYPPKDAAFVKCKAVRAPEFDGWAELDETGHCWNARELPRDKAVQA